MSAVHLRRKLSMMMNDAIPCINVLFVNRFFEILLLHNAEWVIDRKIPIFSSSSSSSSSAYILSKLYISIQYVFFLSLRCEFQFNHFILVPCPYDQTILQTFVNNYLISQQLNSLLVCCKYALKDNQRDESGCPVRIPLMKKKYVYIEY